ncbi:hypothetical protein [Amnibacterium sp.]|uniref:hypothetical protein n=1 Tax=Amnibacterium sp. TaxID=1872496 RepID=UPI003F7BC2E1
MLRRIVLASAALAAVLTGASATAGSAGTAAIAARTTGADQPTQTTTATGHDVSYPQCDRSLPQVGDIAVVGVNAGTGTTTNPCLAEQLAWGDRTGPGGRSLPADVYVNTANPGHLGDWWPTSDLTRLGTPVNDPAGTCSGAEDAACAYVYGYSVGVDDLTSRGVTDPSTRTWWLDVETMNSWSWDRQSNLAVLEGMAAAIRDSGADVGIYSTSRQWHLIVGDATPSVGLSGAPSWIAGATSRSGALANCSAGSLTPAGRVRMVQWVEHGIDHDIACGVGVRGTQPVVEGDLSVGSRLLVSPGAWGPSGVAFRYAWTRDGTPIPGATGAAYVTTDADAGSDIAVSVTGSRLGAPSLTMTSPAVTVTDPEAEATMNAYRAMRLGE